MAENPSSRTTVRRAFLAVSVLVAVYVGAYYAMVTPVVVKSYVEIGRDRWRVERMRPAYRVRAMEPLFVPYYHVDRRLRPGVWTDYTYQESPLERSASAASSR